MFGYAESFDQALGDWDVSRLRFATTLFYRASVFNQRDLVRWDVANVEKFNQIFHDSALKDDECSKQLMYEAWKHLPAFTTANITFGTDPPTYSTWANAVGCPPSAPPPPASPPQYYGIISAGYLHTCAVRPWQRPAGSCRRASALPAARHRS